MAGRGVCDDGGDATMDATSDCGTCKANRGELAAPGGVIYEDAFWRAEHAIEPIPMLGWLVVKPRRHVESWAELTAEEADAFGPISRRLSRGIVAATGAVKVYLCQFGEAQNFAHIHVHLIPRAPDLPSDRRGPGVFDCLRAARAQGNQADPAAAARIVEGIRRHLADDPT